MTRHYLTISIIIASLVMALLYRRHREPIARLARVGGTVAAAIVPRMLAVSTFPRWHHPALLRRHSADR